MSWWERAGERFARTRFGAWFAINVANPIDRRLLRLTRGRVGVFLGAPVGLLTTVGARSGRERATPLVYLDDGERVVLVASKGGAARHPAWYHNLSATPEVGFLRRGGHRARYRAREAEGAEREELWTRVNDLYAGYADYQTRTGGRRIPVIVLDPADPQDG
jgi:deazaflavin-dependent oxidoreductase (nitroreductase family)